MSDLSLSDFNGTNIEKGFKEYDIQKAHKYLRKVI